MQKDFHDDLGRPKKVLITGANGFVGRSLVKVLSSSCSVVAVVRDMESVMSLDGVGASSVIAMGSIDIYSDWSEYLKGVDVVVHCAAKTFDSGTKSENDLFSVNVDGTRRLIDQAIAQKVSRFIFLSSVKVHGESTSPAHAFSAFDTKFPEDAYSRSKCAAEDQLEALANLSNMETVILRPPVVYGFEARGNFLNIMRLASRNLPLPLGSINNARSMVAIDNLVDLIITCIDHPNAANQTFLVSDDHDVSTTELLNTLTRAAGKKPRLIPIPSKLLRLCLTMLGKKAISDRLLNNLQIDITHTKETLDWKPPISFEEGISRCFKKEG